MRQKSREITGARIWPELAAAINAWSDEHGRMSPGNMLRLAVDGLTPKAPSKAVLRQVTMAGDHLDPRVTDDERAVIQCQADALGMSMLDFVTYAVCALVGTPYLTKAQRQKHAEDRNRARIAAARAKKSDAEVAKAIAKCDRYAAIKAGKTARRALTCSPLPATDSRWPTGMTGPDDLRAEYARRRAHLETVGRRRDRAESDFETARRESFRRKMGKAA